MMTTLHLAHADLLGLPKEAFEIDVDFGLTGDPRREANFDQSDSWLRQAATALTESGVAFDMADTHIDPRRLDRYPAVFLQSIDFMDPLDQNNLLGYAEDGGRMVIGPEMPKLDPLLRRTEVFARFLNEPGRASIGNGELIWTDGPGLEALAQELAPEPELRLERGPAELAVLRRRDETLVFVANSTSDHLTAVVLSHGEREYESVWGPKGTTRSDGRFPVDICPYTVRIFAVHSRADSGMEERT
jgi:beta-galactosidase